VIGGSLGYSTDLFEAETIGRLISHFLTLLEDASEHPDRRVSELEMLSVEERAQLAHLGTWNDTQSTIRRTCSYTNCLSYRLSAGPKPSPSSVKARKITYAELNHRANETARCLQRSGVGPETLVGVCLERSLEMVVALLGILKAGGAFVSFDLAYPKERLRLLLADTGVRLLLTQPHLLEKLPPFDGEIMFPEESGAFRDQHGRYRGKMARPQR
jgi:non-ribosomal peptide synthetase component F